MDSSRRLILGSRVSRWESGSYGLGKPKALPTLATVTVYCNCCCCLLLLLLFTVNVVVYCYCCCLLLLFHPLSIATHLRNFDHCFHEDLPSADVARFDLSLGPRFDSCLRLFGNLFIFKFTHVWFGLLGAFSLC